MQPSGLVNIVLHHVNSNAHHILGADFSLDLFSVVFYCELCVPQLGGDLHLWPKNGLEGLKEINKTFKFWQNEQQIKERLR